MPQNNSSTSRRGRRAHTKSRAPLSLQKPFQSLRNLLFDPSYYWYIAALVIAGDAVLTALVILFVSYTEIDFETYMIHIDLFRKGERDYAAITGPTGPLVYPAGHVHIHNLMHNLTNGGADIRIGQVIYGGLYVLSQILTVVIYRQAGNVPNWIPLLLPLSKRLHSIYALRLFNDCWSTVIMQASVLAFGRRLDLAGCLLFSLALSIKMNILLYAPAVLLIVVKRRGLITLPLYGAVILLPQVILAGPFLPFSRSYISTAFDLGRIFLYKWTVNWRCIPETVFLSREWANALLFGHISTLVAFGAFRWCRRDGGIVRTVKTIFRGNNDRRTVTTDYSITVLFTVNLIGLLFARSLHYQFYSWYAQQVPFLMCRTKYPNVVKILLISLIEYAWNVYPSTNTSSAVLLAANTVLLVGVFFGWPEGKR